MLERIFALILAAAALQFSFLSARAAQPNIVLIVADDLGWSDLSGYGSDLHKSPHLDRLAAEGVKFTHAYAAAPVCSPTRASIMTGKAPARLHLTIWHEAARVQPGGNRPLLEPMAEENLPHSEITLAEVLRDAGYFTAHIGKWHLGTSAYYPEAHGFRINVGATFWGAPQTFFYPFNGTQYFGNEFRYVPGLEPSSEGDYLTDRLTDKAIEVIDQVGGKQPLFLNLWYHTPHTPIEGKPEDVQHFTARVQIDAAHQNPEYAAMVASLDENVGRVLEHLESAGLAENTIVIFTSDNGGYIGKWQGKEVTNNAPLRSGKGSLYEGGIRVPLMIRWPGVTPAGGAVCEVPVTTTDFYRTILAMAEVPVDAEQTKVEDGRDFTGLLRNPGDATGWDRLLYFHYPHYYVTTTPASAIRDGKWKLIEYFGLPPEEGLELYDLAADPSETENVSRKHADIVVDLSRKLADWRKSVDAQVPAPNPDYKPKP